MHADTKRISLVEKSGYSHKFDECESDGKNSLRRGDPSRI